MARQKLEVIRPLRNRVGILFSGGLDSAALVAHYLNLGYEVWPVYVRSDLAWEAVEISLAQHYLREISNPLLKTLGIVTLNLEQAYDGNWSRTGHTPGARSNDAEVFLPARNLLLITKSMLLLSAHDVWDVAIATLKGNPFGDARPAYFRLLEKVLTTGFGHPVHIYAPFRRSTKAEIIRAYKGYPLQLSTSCISPNGKGHCGRCNKCAERKRAFKKAGVKDLTDYAAGLTRMVKSVAVN